MQIEQVDPADEADFSRWFAVVDAWQREERPEEPGWFEHELRAGALAHAGPDADELHRFFVAVADGQVLGAARFDLPQRDNTHLAELLLVVHPDHRRRGAGRALTAHVEALAREAGRTTLTAVSQEPPGLVGRSAARSFGPVVGLEPVQVEVRRDLDLPLDPEVVARLSADPPADYEVRTWRDAVPEELLEDQALLLRRMSTDAPAGGMDWQEEEWDAARVRREEQQVAEMDRTWFAAGAVHRPTGRLVAYTRVGLARTALERAHQWDTLVLREHRGHRLGTLVKLACLQRIAQESPTTRFVSTYNAEENEPMIRVNDALGARVNGCHLNWQKRL